MIQTQTKQDRSIGELLKELSVESRSLFRQEVELAKREASEKVSRLLRHAAFIGIGALVALIAAGLLMVALVHGLTVLLALAVGLGVAVWLAPLLLALAVGVTAMVLIRSGLAAIKRERRILPQTKETLQENKEWMKEMIR